MQELNERQANFIKSKGKNPADYVFNGRAIVQRSDVVADSAPVTSNQNARAKEPAVTKSFIDEVPDMLKAAAVEGAQTLFPTVAATTAATATIPAIVGTGGLATPAAIGGSLAVGAGTRALQDVALKTNFPEAYEQVQALKQEHPYASTIGGVLTGGLTSPFNLLANLKRAAALRSLKPLDKNLVQGAIATGTMPIGSALGKVAQVGLEEKRLPTKEELVQSVPTDPIDWLLAFGGGATMGGARPWFNKALGQRVPLTEPSIDPGYEAERFDSSITPEQYRQPEVVPVATKESAKAASKQAEAKTTDVTKLAKQDAKKQEALAKAAAPSEPRVVEIPEADFEVLAKADKIIRAKREEAAAAAKQAKVEAEHQRQIAESAGLVQPGENAIVRVVKEPTATPTPEQLGAELQAKMQPPKLLVEGAEGDVEVASRREAQAHFADLEAKQAGETKTLARLQAENEALEAELLRQENQPKVGKTVAQQMAEQAELGARPAEAPEGFAAQARAEAQQAKRGLATEDIPQGRFFKKFETKAELEEAKAKIQQQMLEADNWFKAGTISQAEKRDLYKTYVRRLALINTKLEQQFPEAYTKEISLSDIPTIEQPALPRVVGSAKPKRTYAEQFQYGPKEEAAPAWWHRFQSRIAEKHGIRVKLPEELTPRGTVKDPQTGKEYEGYVQTRQTPEGLYDAAKAVVADISPARPESGPHEIAHSVIEAMINSGEAGPRTLGKKALDAAYNSEEYRNYLAKKGHNHTEAAAEYNDFLKEFAANTGKKDAKYVHPGGTKLNEFLMDEVARMDWSRSKLKDNSFWKNMWAGAKTYFKSKPALEDLVRVIDNRMRYADPAQASKYRWSDLGVDTATMAGAKAGTARPGVQEEVESAKPVAPEVEGVIPRPDYFTKRFNKEYVNPQEEPVKGIRFYSSLKTKVLDKAMTDKPITIKDLLTNVPRWASKVGGAPAEWRDLLEVTGLDKRDPASTITKSELFKLIDDWHGTERVDIMSPMEVRKTSTYMEDLYQTPKEGTSEQLVTRHHGLPGQADPNHFLRRDTEGGNVSSFVQTDIVTYNALAKRVHEINQELKSIPKNLAGNFLNAADANKYRSLVRERNQLAENAESTVKKATAISEIQSNLHQAGRVEGYKDPKTKGARPSPYKAQLDEAIKQLPTELERDVATDFNRFAEADETIGHGIIDAAMNPTNDRYNRQLPAPVRFYGASLRKDPKNRILYHEAVDYVNNNLDALYPNLAKLKPLLDKQANWTGEVPWSPYQNEWVRRGFKNALAKAISDDSDSVIWPRGEEVAEHWEKTVEEAPIFSTVYDTQLPMAAKDTFAQLGLKTPAIKETMAKGVKSWEVDLTPETKAAIKEQGLAFYKEADSPEGDTSNEPKLYRSRLEGFDAITGERISDAHGISAYDMVAKKVSPKLANAMIATEERIRELLGSFINLPAERLSNYSDYDIAKAYETRLKAYKAGNMDPKFENLEQIKINDIFTDWAIQTGEASDRAGILVAGRPRGYNPMYTPEVIRADVLREMQNKSPKGVEYLNEWTEHIASQMTKGTVEERATAAQKMVSEYVNALSAVGEGASYMGSKFHALDKPAGYGVPDSMREMNPWLMLDRYGRRAARDIAIHEHLGSDTEIRDLLGMADRNTGEMTAEAKNNNMAGNEHVKGAMSWILGDVDRQHKPLSKSAMRIVANLGMQFPTGARDLLAVPGIAARYMKLPEVPKMAFSAIKELGAARRESLMLNVRNKKLDTLSMGLIEDARDSVMRANMIADNLRKYGGRDAMEQSSRIFSYGIAKQLARVRLQEALNGDANAIRMINKVTQLVDLGKIDLNDAASVEQAVQRIAAGLTERIQGTYGGRGLPSPKAPVLGATVEGPLAPFFALSKWSMEQANNAYKDVAVEGVKHGNWTPALMYTLGSFISAEAIKAFNDILRGGKKTDDPTAREALTAVEEDKKVMEVAAYLTSMAQISGFGGITADLAKMSTDVFYKKDMPRGFGFPLLDMVAKGFVDNIVKYNQAVAGGTDKTDAALELMLNFAIAHIQNAGIIAAHVGNKADRTEEQNKNRDLRVFNRAKGYPVASSAFATYNPMLTPNIKKLKRSTVGSKEFEESLSPALEEAFRSGKDPVRALTVDRVNYMPSPIENPERFMEYMKWLDKTKNQEGAGLERALEYKTQKIQDKARSEEIKRRLGVD